MLTGAPVRNRYRVQIERIASQQPLDRDDELAELARFCTDPRYVGAYRWWRAPAWSGKTTLLSWFVLHPPPGVRIVSFFVTARLAAQNTRSAFVDTLLEQLLAMLGEPVPYLTDATRDGHVLGLLADAARACWQRGEQFVLVVDGLDEDRGVVTGPGAHSIAALLPAHPPAGMRVIVAGRTNPPVPDDVPDSHPLRDASVVRVLAASPHAQARQFELTQDLHDLLAGTLTEQDIVGLLIAAGGGLSAADLGQLTGWSPRRVASKLDTVTGRVLDRREARWGRADGYLLGHEELHQAAAAELGPDRIAGYRQRLHAWAEDYRERGWPSGAPEYLLDGYVAMLIATGDLRRAAAFVTDAARHDRMLDASGGDTASLAEVQAVARRLAEQDDPDLAVLGRVLVHRDQLIDRNSHVPAELLPVWAGLGNLDRAENLAGTLASDDYQYTFSSSEGTVEAVIGLARAAMAAGEDDRAHRLVARAEELARGVTVWGPEIGVSSHPWSQAWVLARVVGAVEALGQHDRAEAMASTLFTVESKVMALTGRVKDTLAAGAHADARRLAEEAEALARTFSFNSSPVHQEQTRAWVGVAEAMAALGQHDRAVEFVRSIPSRNQIDQVNAFARVAEVLAATDASDQASHLVADAESLLTSPDFPFQTYPYFHSHSLARLTRAATVAGDSGRAARLIADAEVRARSLTSARSRVLGLTAVAEAAAAACENDCAEALVIDAEALANTIERSYDKVRILADLAEVAITTGNRQRAETLALTITEPQGQAWVLARLAKWAISQEERELARRLATDAETRARAASRTGQRLTAPLVPLVSALADIGEHDLAHRLARTIRSPGARTRALRTVAAAVAAAGNQNDTRQITAEAVAAIHAMRPVEYPTYALCELAKTMATAGEHALAERLAADAEDLIRATKNKGAVPLLAETWVRLGELSRAEILASGLSEEYLRISAFTSTASAAAAAGHHDYAHRLAAKAEAAIHAYAYRRDQVEKLCELAETMATAGELALASRLVTDAEAILRATRPSREGFHEFHAARALGAIGEFDRARALCHTIPDQGAGVRVEILSKLAQRAASAGEMTHARRLAEDAASSIRDYMSMDGRMRDLVRAMVAAGESDAAERIANTITDSPIWRARALVDVVEDAVATGQSGRAHRLVTDARAVISNITDPTNQYKEMVGLLRSIMEGTNRYRAKAPAHSAGSSDEFEAQTALWSRRLFAETVLSCGWHKNAESLDPFQIMAFACPRALTAIADEILAC